MSPRVSLEEQPAAICVGFEELAVCYALNSRSERYGTVASKRLSGRYVAARGRGAQDAAFLLSWFEIGIVLIVEGAKVARRNSGNLSASVSETRSRHSSRP